MLLRRFRAVFRKQITLLHKLLYLSALDQHEEVVELFENIKSEISLESRIGLNMMLACLSSYRYTGKLQSA